MAHSERSANRAAVAARRRVFGLLVAGVGLALGTPTPLLSAQSACPSGLESVRGDAGYQARGGDPLRCEGFFIGRQNSLNVQVISVTKGPIPTFDTESLFIGLPTIETADLEPEVRIVGLAREANLNWRLDYGPAKAPGELPWPLAHAKTLHNRVGLVAETTEKSGFGEKVYVPMCLGKVSGLPCARSNADVEVVLLIPAAGAITWGIEDSPESPLIPTDGDGYVGFSIPGSLSTGAVVDLNITWYARHTFVAGPAPERLRLFLP